jgi:hypothetical protein
MEKPKIPDVPQAGDHLRSLVRVTSFCGLFFSLTGTLLVWAGTDSFDCPKFVWKASLTISLFFFTLPWIVYLLFRNTDRLLGNGLLAVFLILSLFWLFGFSGFYFYFLFAPVSIWPQTIALNGVTAILLYRAYITILDINNAFRKNKNLFNQIYREEGTSITFQREAIGLLEKYRRDRNPFKSAHTYAAMIVSPFVLVLNKVLTPILGEGHGVFMVLTFFTVPILLWGVGIFMQTIMTMIYYPIKLQQETGKPVLLKDW